MRSALLSGLVAAGLASAASCDGGGGNHYVVTGAAGKTGASGTGAAAATGTAGARTDAGLVVWTPTGAGWMSTADATGAAGTGVDGGAAVVTVGPVKQTASTGYFSEVLPTEGCGQPRPPTGAQTIMTMGMKDAQCADKMCGAWAYPREYFVNLPPGYDNTKAWPLIFEGPGCGGKGNNLYNNPTLAGMAIRIGLSPSADAQAFHATYPNQGCFDDHEGDDSIEWAFYEAVWDRLATQLCFDRNRVFAAGNHSGALVANQLGCKYAGDAKHPIRGVMTNDGALLPSTPPPDSPQGGPTCSSKPLAGMWVWANAAPDGAITKPIAAIDRALQVNGCTATTYQDATFFFFPISAGDSTTCTKIVGCPDATPLVTCSLPLQPKYSHESVVNPGWVAFLKLFLASPPPAP